MAAGAAVWDASHARLTMGLLLTISITAFEALAVGTVLPATAADLGGSSAAAAMGWYGWVFSAFMLANLVGIPAAGMLSDRSGTARPFVIGCALFALGLLVAGFAPSMPVLVAGRVAQGLGAGALSSIVYVAVARAYDSADQPRMLALLASAWVVPGMIAPSCAAALAHAFGWRSVFLLLVPMTFVAAALSVEGMGSISSPETTTDASDGRDKISTALQLAFGTGIAMLAAGTHSLLPALVCAAIGVAIAVPALRKLVPAGTLTAARGAPAALAVKTLVTIAFFGAEAFLPLALTSVRGESLAMAGFALTGGTLCWTSGTWIQERLVARVPRVTLVRWGLALTAIAIAGAASVLVVADPRVVAIVSWAIAGLGIGLAYPTTTLIVFDLSPKGGEGEAAAALQLANVLGVALGTGIGGAVLGVATSLGRTQAYAIGAIDALMLATALAGLALASRCRARPARMA